MLNENLDIRNNDEKSEIKDGKPLKNDYHYILYFYRIIHI